MRLKKVIIENFKCFRGKFELELNEGLNILVGDNESGKSTILEAVHLALSGWFHGRHIRTELGEALFNKKVMEEYISGLHQNGNIDPPRIRIELFFEIDDDATSAIFEGDNNLTRQRECGIRFEILFQDRYRSEYDALLKNGDLKSLPIEYYDCEWQSFARDSITPRRIPFKSSFIDSASGRYQNGSDAYISRIIRDLLEEDEKVKISQAHRGLKDSFDDEEIVKTINERLSQGEISDKNVTLSADVSTKTAWETSLKTYLDDIPFDFVGKGEQTLVKTQLALSHKKAKKANILLLEEPENHLSHSKLNKLIEHLKVSETDYSNTKQVIISTHSSFVANKFNLVNLIILNEAPSGSRSQSRMNDLTSETQKFFEKLPGYDTLRIILCRKVILVEGPSDELVVQKAYIKHKGKLPIEDRVDVISVGTSFLRFLEIAKKIKKPVAVVADNDGNYKNNIVKKYAEYEKLQNVRIFAGKNNCLRTLEPQIINANLKQLNVLADIFNVNNADSQKIANALETYMQNNKTGYALQLFETDQDIDFPQYILDAVNWEYESE